MITCDDVDALRAFGRPLGAEAEAHVRACARCREEASALAAVSTTLAASSVQGVPAGLTAQVLAAAAPLLAANAARAARRRLLRALAAGLAPLPAILVLDFWLVRAGYDLLTRFLPDALSLYVVANWVGFLALLLALTYGAIPFLAARQAPALEPRST
jgi:hypothetical protein